MSVKYGVISKVTSEITDDISNHNGKHNNFVVVTNSEEHYPGKVDPVILRYDDTVGEWIFVADKTIVDFGYLTEVLQITDNDLLLEKEPLDGVLWDVFILDEDENIIQTLNPTSLRLDKNYLSGLEQYKGQSLSLMYAFGDKEDDGVIVPVDTPVEGEYLNEEVDVMKYDGPYDMNDILEGINYPPASTAFDKVILERIEELDNIVRSFAGRKLYTTPKLLITDNKATLPYMNIGGVVHDMAMLFTTSDRHDRMIALEVTCRAENGVLIFDELDEVNGYYAVVTYLADTTPYSDLDDHDDDDHPGNSEDGHTHGNWQHDHD